MSRSIQYCLMALLAIILTACTTAPKKPSSSKPQLPQAQINRLKAMSMPTRLAIPVDGVNHKTSQILGVHLAVLGEHMKELTSLLHVEPKFTVALKV